jgi:hypothetical protein
MYHKKRLIFKITVRREEGITRRKVLQGSIPF